MAKKVSRNAFDAPLLRPATDEPGCNEYVLMANTTVWIAWQGFSISIMPTSGGIAIDALPRDEEGADPLGSLYVTEGVPCDDENDGE